jgi:hypothetical protein
MRYLYSILLLTLLTACDSEPSDKAAKDEAPASPMPNACMQQSDWFYEGYNGKPKKVVRMSTPDTTVGWDIAKAASYDVQTSYYTPDGYIEKKTVAIYQNGQLLNETTHTIQGINPRVETSVDKKGITTIDSTTWDGDRLMHIRQYQQVNGKQRPIATTANTLDDRCMVANTRYYSYEWEGGNMVMKERYGYDYSQLPDSVQQGRLKYGNAYIYRGFLYNTAEWDGTENPTKLTYENGKGITHIVMQYEYYN